MPASLEGLIERKTWAVFNALLRNPEKLFHLNSLAKSAKVPVSSTSRIIKKLVKTKFAEEMKVGKLSVYKLAVNTKVEGLLKL